MLSMLKIGEKVREARRYFGIEKYPGAFFSYLNQGGSCIKKYGIVLFRQNLGENISGFIGYVDDAPVICINTKMSLGHQNFTLAHEIGHYFLHKGYVSDDTESDIKNPSGSEMEIEAHKFASELLYPAEFLSDDMSYFLWEGLINKRKRLQLADFIAELCQKYCTSFSFTIRKILYTYQLPNADDIIDSVYNEIGKLTDRYDSIIFNKYADADCYKPYAPIEIMKYYVDVLTDAKKIGLETGQAILKDNMDLGV